MVDISSYLTPHERILKKWRDGSTNICATDKRIILERNDNIIDAPYHHISSIELKKTRSRVKIAFVALSIIIGVLLSTVDFFSFILIPPAIRLIFPTIGLSLIIFAIILFIIPMGTKIKIHISNQEPVELSGNMKSMVRWVRDYKARIEINSTKEKYDVIIPEDKTEANLSTKEKFLIKAMKALNKGNTELAKKFIIHARSLPEEKKALIIDQEKVSSPNKEKASMLKESKHTKEDEIPSRKRGEIPRSKKVPVFEEPKFRICPVCSRELLPKTIHCDQCGAKLANLFKRAHNGGLFG